MPRKKRSASPFELMDDDFDEDASSQGSRNENPPIQRNAANARERARMRVLSSAFGRLKTKLPNIPSDTKLSKLDTLRLATMYIKQLKAVVEGTSPLGLNGGDDDMDGSSLNDTPSCYLQLHSGAQSMNWPFGLHHQVNNNHNSSSGRSQAHHSIAITNGNATTSSWSPSEVKQSRYDSANYQQHQQEPVDHHQQQNNNTPAYVLTPSSSTSLLTTSSTPPNSQQQEIIWYSETPSPDLSTSTSSSVGVGGYESPGQNHHHHHHHQHTQSQHQRHSHSLMEHLSHMQLTPPPPPPPLSLTHSSGSRHSFQQHQNTHLHHSHHVQHSNQYSSQAVQNHPHHQNFANSNHHHFAAASIR